MTFVQSARKNTLRIFCLLLIALCCMGLWLCYYNETYTRRYMSTPNLLHDVLLGPRTPSVGRSIFFLDTSHSELYSTFNNTFAKLQKQNFNFVNLTARAACAVESAALHNPKSDIFVLIASPVYWQSTTKENSTINAVLSYPNVYLRSLNLRSYVADTPIEVWFETKKLFESNFLKYHMSDFLRYLTLWRYGGTYLDMDVIVLRSLEELPPNYAGAESSNDLGSCVLNFGYDDMGRQVAAYCLNDLQKNFNGSVWSTNGPGVITRTLKHFCATDKIAEMFDKERCLGFQVYKQDSFYAVHWSAWKNFFEPNKTQSTLERIKNSYVVHFWNYLSKALKIRISASSAYGELAAKHCPKVFATIGDYF